MGGDYFTSVQKNELQVSFELILRQRFAFSSCVSKC